VTKRFFIRVGAVLALTLSGLALAASPSVKDVYTAVRAGRVAEAETMMQQVLAEHPQSAEAHYVDAEVEYRAGHFDRAREELATAERINPALPFASPHSVAELKTGLANGGRVRTGTTSAYASGGGSRFPWGLFLGLVAIVLLIVLLMRRRQPTVVVGNGYGQPGYGPGAPMGGGPAPMGGPGYGYGYGPGAMGQGSGLMGSVASGLAVGAGIVAGEELARRVFEPGHPNYVPPSQDTYVDPNADMGGDNFGVSDAGSDWGDSGGFSGGGGGDDWS
jgi:uncharacterized protein